MITKTTNNTKNLSLWTFLCDILDDAFPRGTHTPYLANCLEKNLPSVGRKIATPNGSATTCLR